MNWLNEFYSKQYIWSKEYLNQDFTLLREDLLDTLKSHTSNSTKTILELGSGLGQFAVAAAKEGYEVTAIELTEEGVTHAKRLAKTHGLENQVSIIQGDFYQEELMKTFDVVCYWDGFGIGSDPDQQRLLNRVSKWLKADGIALIDIYTPWYWAKTAGQEKTFGDLKTIYDFDAEKCQMIDTWWINGKPEDKVTQYLRCYSPADLKLLTRDLALDLHYVDPGGAMDYEEWKFHPKVPLYLAMSYTAVLTNK